MKRYEHNFGKNPQGALSTVSGYATETTNFGETAFGILNKSTIDKNNFTTPEVVSSSTATLFSVGNGTDTDNRKNIIELKADGTVFISGVGGYDGTNPEDSKDISKELQSVHDDIDNINLDIDRIDSDIDSIHVEQDSDLVYTFIVKGENRGTINIPRDQFLKDVNYDEETNILEFLFIVRNEENEEEQKVVKIDMTDLEDIYTNGDGLNLENKQFSIKIDADTQPYINVGPNGLKIIGINEALDKKVSWDESKKVITLPADGSISALRNNGLEGGVLVCQRTYDDGATYVTEIGTTKNNLTLNSIERPKIDFAGGASENVAYESEVKSLQDRMSTAETDIDNLEGRMDVAEGDIDTIQSDLSELIGDGEGSVQDQIKTALEDYLPLSGGTMTGNITFGSESEDYTGGIIISGKSDQDLVNAVGGTTTIDSIREGLATEDALNEYKTSNDEKIQSIEDKLDQEIEAGNTDKETIDNYTVNGHKISENPVLTKTDIGLNQVDNVQQIPMSMKGQAGGVAELDANGKVPSSQLELLALGEVAGTAYEGNKGAANKAAIGTNTYTGANYISKETNLTDAVLQLDEEIKATNDNLALEHTNAEAKYAKKTDLSGYLPLSGGILTGTTEIHKDGFQLCLFGGVDGITQYNENSNPVFSLQPSDNGSGGLSLYDKDNSDISISIRKSGITLKGQGKTTSDLLNAGGSTTSISDITTQVQAAIVDSAPETLDTLNELAAALGDDPNFATTVTNQIASKQDKLVSGTNIKTINGQTLLGSGDIALDAEHITVKDTLGYFSGNNVESALQEIAQPLDTHLQNMTSGLRHIPSGGAPNNILAWDSEGTAKWENLSNIEVSTDDLLAYGVQWDTTVSDPVLTRIGNTSLHKSLPIQSGMYGCICQGSTIRYRLDDEDWRFKRTPDTPITVSLTQENDIITINDPIFATKQYEKQWIKINDIKIQIDSIDTETQTATLVPNEYTGTLHTGQYSCELGSVRNGYDGSVRVYVPGFYYKSTQTGNICQVLLSISQIDSTYHYQQPVLIDAYRCTVLNTVPENMGWLSTLPVNTAVSIANVNSYCRGGNNNSSFDQYLENDPRRTQLGKPRTNLSRATMRGYAANNNSHLLTYEEYKNIFYWLYVVEYANFNSQATFSSSLDDNGYRTGGLGNGVTTVNYNVWIGYNSVYPLTPCGYLDSLGGNPGVEPQVLAAFDMTVTPTKNWGSWTTQTYRSGNNNLNRATMSKGNPTLTITHVDNVGQILYCRSDNVSGVATYTVSGLQSGQKLRFECSGQTTQIVTIDGQITMDWGTNGAQTRSLYANFTGDCNITVTCDSVVDSIVAEYPSQSITVNRWRGFDNPFGDIWTNLDGVIIDADADNHENSTDYVYVCTDPSKFSDTLTDDYIKIAESTHNEGYVKAFDLGDDANIIASTVGGGSTTYMCDYHWTGNANTTLRTLYVGGYADGARAGLGGLSSNAGVSYAASYRGFRSVSVVSQ